MSTELQQRRANHLDATVGAVVLACTVLAAVLAPQLPPWWGWLGFGALIALADIAASLRRLVARQ